jgi:DNA-binding NtrC family response regulator
VLTLVHHPELDEVVGERLVVGETKIVLGRGCPHFSSPAFQHTRVSRRHAEVSAEGGALRIADLGSRNGTLVNGNAVERLELDDGDVVMIGGIMLLAHHGPRFVPPRRGHEIVGIGSACARIQHRIALAAPKDVTVLIRGETGVGKELVARAIHRESGRTGAFVALNCGSIADGVLQSELFGHAKGSFSGALAAREGLVAAAHEGTLFLDEIGDASASFQATLLRLLEQREYRPMGSNEERQATARFVAATHVALDDAVDAGRFRADLKARLERWVIDVPPLRDRREDILPLALHFIAPPARLSRSLAHALIRYDWPANVRELQSVMEEAQLEQVDDEPLALTPALAQRLRVARDAVRDSTIPPPRPSRRGLSLPRPSAEVLVARFRELGENARALAEELGVGRTTLYRWFRDAGVDMRNIRDD